MRARPISRHYGVTEVPQILLSDIDSTYTVAVILKSALAGIVSVIRFLSVATFWASLRSIGFVNDFDFDTKCFRLVGD